MRPATPGYNPCRAAPHKHATVTPTCTIAIPSVLHPTLVNDSLTPASDPHAPQLDVGRHRRQ